MSDTSAEYTGATKDQEAWPTKAAIKLFESLEIPPNHPVTWKPYPTMYVLAENERYGMNQQRGITVRVVNEGGGAYLALTGFNLNPDEPNENPHEFYLATHGQIDRLAGTLHDLLRAAEEADQ